MGGGGSGYSSGSSRSYSSGGGFTDYGETKTRVPKPETFKTEFGKFNEDQAAGFRFRPTAMIPRVDKNLTPDIPEYGRLQDLPAAEMALLMGGKVATEKGFTKNLGNLYQGAIDSNDIPTIDEMLAALQSGGPKNGGLQEMFQGIKLKDASRSDIRELYPTTPKKQLDFKSIRKSGSAESTLAPGYLYGKEPMTMGSSAEMLDSLVNAVYASDPILAAKYGADGGWADYMIDKWGAKASKKPAGKGKKAYRSVGRGLSQ